MANVSGIFRSLDTFADVSRNGLQLSRRLKITEVKFTYPKGYNGVTLSVPLFSLDIVYANVIIDRLVYERRLLSNDTNDDYPDVNDPTMMCKVFPR